MKRGQGKEEKGGVGEKGGRLQQTSAHVAMRYDEVRNLPRVRDALWLTNRELMKRQILIAGLLREGRLPWSSDRP